MLDMLKSDAEDLSYLPLRYFSSNAFALQIVHYVPKFYFGSLLMMFGVEILRDWLLLSFRKVHKKEYILLWLTFLAIMIGEIFPISIPAAVGCSSSCLHNLRGFPTSWPYRPLEAFQADPGTGGT